MIVDAVLSVFFGILTVLLSPLPAVAGPDLSGLVDSSGVWQGIAWVNLYMPVDQALLIVGTVVPIVVIVYGIKGVLWLSGKIQVFGNKVGD